MKEQHGQIMEEQSRFRFGNYDLVRRIDVGGMGEVYLARQRSAFDREVAIKIIREDLVHDITARERFLREAEVSAHLKHEHILPLFEFGEEQGRLFLVTPYIEGGTLAQRLQKGPLPLSEVRRLFPALVQAVAYIHRRGVVHRDLKPGNILLDQGSEGQVYVRLIDFGIARIQGTSASPPLTVAGQEMGTIAYMAPERLSGIAAPSNDIYSLGVILYQMLTGQLPTTGQRIPLPQTLEYVVRRCMAARIDERFPSAEDVLEAFVGAAVEQSGVGALAVARDSTRAPAPTSTLADTEVAGQANRWAEAPQASLAARGTPAATGVKRETVSLERSADVSPVGGTFSPADYDAPTTAVDSSQIPGKGPTEPVSAGGPPHRTHGQRKPPVAPIIITLAIVTLLAMAGILAFQILAFSTASIHFSPQTHLVSAIFQIKAKTSIKKIDVASASMPAYILSKSRTDSLAGPATGVSCGIFSGCQQVVSPSDVDALATQLRQNLDPQIQQDLQRQIQALGATQVGSIGFSDVSPTPTADPPVGSPARTVKVTLTEQGSIGYFVNSDAQTLVRQLLLKQMQSFGPHYRPLNQPKIQIGQPVIAAVSDTGVVTINMAAGGYVGYQFTQAELLAIQAHIAGMTVKNARIFIAHSPGVDTNTVSISFTSLTTGGKNKIPNDGDTLPRNPQQIKIIPTDTATLSSTLPPVQLPRVTR